ncbi:MAG: hypothetical protein JWP44_1171 [Mucilaginibacter sp.]|nr:hypothetical protein [Mucilaginibacter sp.]
MRNPEKETTLVKSDQAVVTRLDVQDLASIENAVNQGIKKIVIRFAAPM